jgi:hypothetical protein
VTRHYHGHLSAVCALSLHPTLDVLVTCGRDSVARVSSSGIKVDENMEIPSAYHFINSKKIEKKSKKKFKKIEGELKKN